MNLVAALNVVFLTLYPCHAYVKLYHIKPDVVEGDLTRVIIFSFVSVHFMLLY